MRTTNTTTTNRPTLLADAVQGIADFTLGALPTLAALGGIVALFVAPLWILARTLGVC